jgi:8-oxo-dGTP diphosphatase
LKFGEIIFIENVKPQFGTNREGVEYTERPGVYAIIVDSEENIAAVEVGGRYFLLGGGLNEGETEENGLQREILEETGKIVTSATFLGRASQFVDAKDGYFNKLGAFYKVELGADTFHETEEDHKFIWVTKDEFKRRGAQEFQVWAVENLYIKK